MSEAVVLAGERTVVSGVFVCTYGCGSFLGFCAYRVKASQTGGAFYFFLLGFTYMLFVSAAS